MDYKPTKTWHILVTLYTKLCLCNLLLIFVEHFLKWISLKQRYDDPRRLGYEILIFLLINCLLQQLILGQSYVLGHICFYSVENIKYVLMFDNVYFYDICLSVNLNERIILGCLHCTSLETVWKHSSGHAKRFRNLLDFGEDMGTRWYLHEKKKLLLEAKASEDLLPTLGFMSCVIFSLYIGCCRQQAVLALISQ